MPKMIVGRQVDYLEIFEIDTDKIPSGRDDLDLCERVLYSADPDLSQRVKSGEEKSGIKLIRRTMNRIITNPIHPVLDCVYSRGLDEAPGVKYD